MPTLKPHDHVSEVYVCRQCMEQIDPIGHTYENFTDEDAQEARCPFCGGTDTAWLFDEEDSE